MGEQIEKRKARDPEGIIGPKIRCGMKTKASEMQEKEGQGERVMKRPK